MSGTRDSPKNGSATGPSIDAVIDGQLVRTLFQPVVHLATGTVAGFEALTRGPAGVLESPMALLVAAQTVGRLGERAECTARASSRTPNSSIGAAAYR